MAICSIPAEAVQGNYGVGAGCPPQPSVCINLGPPGMTALSHRHWWAEAVAPGLSGTGNSYTFQPGLRLVLLPTSLAG